MAEATSGTGFGLNDLKSFVTGGLGILEAREVRKATEAQAAAEQQVANLNLQNASKQAETATALASASGMTAKTKMILYIVGGVVALAIVFFVIRRK